MGKLIKIDEALLKEGADPYQLWRAVKQMYEQLNALTVTISPDNAGNANITEGDIQINLRVITDADAPNVIPGYAPAGSSVEDSGGTDDSLGNTGGGS